MSPHCRGFPHQHCSIFFSGNNVATERFSPDYKRKSAFSALPAILIYCATPLNASSPCYTKNCSLEIETRSCSCSVWIPRRRSGPKWVRSECEAGCRYGVSWKCIKISPVSLSVCSQLYRCGDGCRNNRSRSWFVLCSTIPSAFAKEFCIFHLFAHWAKLLLPLPPLPLLPADDISGLEVRVLPT